ncbi:hypothetical protein CSB45_11400 [candidate division KSB3 bacterium]|uniref:Uncharacterized protein n=1 Tax=candidate division KSB3 bacterium TaxID=2044937 RepID=A0A2G6E308_9BACT|nr:MAG: hypothetical protein CSB45_11400 [candidate division KSB3 bacterium]
MLCWLSSSESTEERKLDSALLTASDARLAADLGDFWEFPDRNILTKLTFCVEHSLSCFRVSWVCTCENRPAYSV